MLRSRGRPLGTDRPEGAGKNVKRHDARYGCEHEVGRGRLHALQCLVPVLGNPDPVATRVQYFAEDSEIVRVVIRNQDGRHLF